MRFRFRPKRIRRKEGPGNGTTNGGYEVGCIHNWRMKGTDKSDTREGRALEQLVFFRVIVPWTVKPVGKEHYICESIQNM